MIITDTKARKTAAKALAEADRIEALITAKRAEVARIQANAQRLRARLAKLDETAPTQTGIGDEEAARALLDNPGMAAGDGMFARLAKRLTGEQAAVRKHRDEAGPLKAAIRLAEQDAARLEQAITQQEAELHDARGEAYAAIGEALRTEAAKKASELAPVLAAMERLWWADDYRARETSPNATSALSRPSYFQAELRVPKPMGERSGLDTFDRPWDAQQVPEDALDPVFAELRAA